MSLQAQTPEQQRVLLVLARMTAMVETHPDAAESFAEHLEPAMERIAEDYVFGVSREWDPRGDARRGDWSMSRVEGLDD